MDDLLHCWQVCSAQPHFGLQHGVQWPRLAVHLLLGALCSVLVLQSWVPGGFCICCGVSPITAPRCLRFRNVGGVKEDGRAQQALEMVPVGTCNPQTRGGFVQVCVRLGTSED